MKHTAERRLQSIFCTVCTPHTWGLKEPVEMLTVELVFPASWATRFSVFGLVTLRKQTLTVLVFPTPASTWWQETTSASSSSLISRALKNLYVIFFYDEFLKQIWSWNRSSLSSTSSLCASCWCFHRQNTSGTSVTLLTWQTFASPVMISSSSAPAAATAGETTSLRPIHPIQRKHRQPFPLLHQLN